MNNLKLLKNLKTGDAFEYNGITYVALGVSDEDGYITCLDSIKKELVFLDVETIVEVIQNWYITENYQPTYQPIIGEPLRRLN